MKLNANDDILYKWRLRRKLDENKGILGQQIQISQQQSNQLFHTNFNIDDFLMATKKPSLLLHNNNNIPSSQNTTTTQPTITLPPTPLPPPPSQPGLSVQSQLSMFSPSSMVTVTNQSPNTGLLTPISTSTIATMTSPIKNVTEMAVQTSLESNHINSSIHEKPTRDENVNRRPKSKSQKASNQYHHYNLNSRKPVFNEQTNVIDSISSINTNVSNFNSICKSPTRKPKTSSVSLSSVQKSNLSDLTKISSIEDLNAENNNNNNNNSSIDLTNSIDENLNDKTSVKNNELIVYNNKQTQRNQQQKQQQQKTLTKTNDNFNNNNNYKIKSTNLVIDSAYYESDEILNILFRKLFFYQSKLK